MELEKAREIAKEVRRYLDGSCVRIEIAGSIRRRKKDVGDIELLCISRFDGGFDCLDRRVQGLMFQGVLALRLNKLGRKVYGPKNKLLLHVPSGIGVDIFSTTEECWPVSLVVRTGGKATNVRIATAALQLGYQFHAYGSGFSTPHGEIVCRSEREVFGAVELPYLEPWERD
jgi:DNA polymerase (family 10)